METKFLSILSVLVLPSSGEKPCPLAESGPSPYLIRIFTATDSSTYGHGSLIRQDRVLSTCTPFKDLPRDLEDGKWRLSGYNFHDKCEQIRHPLEIEIHAACKKPDPSLTGTTSHDLALWTVEPFTLKGSPFLWGNGKHLPPPLTTVGSIIDSLFKFRKALTVGLFDLSFSHGPALQSSTKISFIDWFVCLDMLKNVTDTTGDMTNGLDNSTFKIQGFYGYFCGYDVEITWDSQRRIPKQVYADMYSGAAVMYESASGSKVPIGLLSRGVTISSTNEDIKNFRIIMGFHEGVYDFLSDHGIEPSPLELELNHVSPTTFTGAMASGLAIARRIHPQNNHQSSVHTLDGLWIIHLALFCSTRMTLTDE